MSDKCAVFIDGAYLQNVQEHFGLLNSRFDFEKLSDLVAEKSKSERFRTYYYDCAPYQSSPPTKTEKKRVSNYDKFLRYLGKLPRHEVKLGKLSFHNGEYTQKRVDQLMTVDIIKLSSTGCIQKAILITGDSDMVPAVQEAKTIGVLVQLHYIPASIHDELWSICDDRFEITKELLESCSSVKRTKA